jgi:hypothetical protein
MSNLQGHLSRLEVQLRNLLPAKDTRVASPYQERFDRLSDDSLEVATVVSEIIENGTAPDCIIGRDLVGDVRDFRVSQSQVSALELAITDLLISCPPLEDSQFRERVKNILRQGEAIPA